MSTWTHLTTTTVSGTSTASIAFAGISQSYKDLSLWGMLKDSGTGTAGQSGLQVYFKDSGGNSMDMAGGGPQYAYIYDYSSTTVAKNVMWLNGITGNDAQNANNTFQAWRMCVNDSGNDPISEITITSQSNYFVPGATMSLYGITA
jgi:hypothetical protein